MNKILLQGKRDFPFTTNVFKFFQDANSIFEKFAAFGGDNYILSGCVNAAGVVSSGFVVLNGILMPFTGGVVQEYIKIVETDTAITVDTGTRNEIAYHAEFGTTTVSALQFDWEAISANTFFDLLSVTKKLADTGWVNTIAIADMTTFDVRTRTKNGYVVVEGTFVTNGSVYGDLFRLSSIIQVPDQATRIALLPTGTNDIKIVELGTNGILTPIGGGTIEGAYIINKIYPI
ncbi:MAG: hypothetical protein IMY72_11695 [Bacteroidetes bacterium]|nr:hypothetical protein [Bacteroidota bacterium]